MAGELQHGSAGALAAEEGGHAWDPITLRAEALLDRRGREVFSSENRFCIAGYERVLELPLAKSFYFLFPLILRSFPRCLDIFLLTGISL